MEAAGGRVDERNEQAATGKSGGATADLVVRVPSDALTDVLADLKDLGDIANVSISHSDVTSTAVDLDARISALQTSVARLQALMNNAATTEALLAAEDAISDRQPELESLQSQRALLADQVELSTLSVHLITFGVAPPGGPDGFLDGLATGWRALVTALVATSSSSAFSCPGCARRGHDLRGADDDSPDAPSCRGCGPARRCRPRVERPIHSLIGSRNCARLAGCRPRRTLATMLRELPCG